MYRISDLRKLVVKMKDRPQTRLSLARTLLRQRESIR
jgi:hypothetical protein